MAQPRQTMWSRLYRFCNDYPIVVFPLAVDLYRIVICSDYTRPTFTECVLWITVQCVCWSTLLLTLTPIVHLAMQLLKRVHEMTATMKRLRKKYRSLEPSTRDALHRWAAGQKVGAWRLVAPFDWYSYAMENRHIGAAAYCDTQSHTQLTEKVFYVQMHRSTRTWRFFEQSIVNGALKLLRTCPDLNDGRKRGYQAFCTNGTLVVIIRRGSLMTDDFSDDPDIICYHIQTDQLWRSRLPMTKEIIIRTTIGNIFSVICDAQGLLSSIYWSCNVSDRMGQPFRNSIRTDYYLPTEFQRVDDYCQVTMASRRTAEEIYVPDNPESKTHGFYVSDLLHGLRTQYRDRRNEQWLLCNPHDAENRYKLVNAVGLKEVGYLCGPRQYTNVCEILTVPLNMAASSTRESEKEILMHIGGFNVIRTTFGQVQPPHVQTGNMLFRLSAMFNDPPPAIVQEYLVADVD